MFDKILIANRGEIGCRVIRTAKGMGLSTVAVYSEADRNALHVQVADEAVCIGEPPPAKSYLAGEKIVEAAKRTGAAAVHPGYGFLSENPDFVELCESHGLIFIGPPASAIRAMGSKSVAKRIMEGAGVPLVPGYHGEEQRPELLLDKAREIGFPVLLKPVAGGGGKGMRQVWSESEFMEGLMAARREAMAGFGDDTMLIEKLLVAPRHVEIQVFCDNHRNGVYLADRDCSVQRRHQKIIEEAPAPGLSGGLRERMGKTALDAARAIDYVGAGTVEFLLDRNGSFYFMEMNTRLQVEHPVTEMVTSLDLVEWQLRVAAGEPLPLRQDQIQVRGHAIEARIYAEDPDREFLPASGTVRLLEPPEERDWLRLDSGVSQGDEISVYYDPMIAKLIVWGEDRPTSIARMKRALAEYRLLGIPTNTSFLKRVVGCEPFLCGGYDTGIVEENLATLLETGRTVSEGGERNNNMLLAVAAIYLKTVQERQLRSSQSLTEDPWSPWSCGSGFRINEPWGWRIQLETGDEVRQLWLQQDGEVGEVHVGEERFGFRSKLQGEELHVELDGLRSRVTGDYIPNSGELTVFWGGNTLQCRLREPGLAETDLGGGTGVTGFGAPMNGTIVSLVAPVGQRVEKGAPLLVMEAMKMEHTIRAPSAGKVEEFFCQEGELVEGGMELLSFQEQGAS